MAVTTINIDLNRVEGDLEFQLDVEDGVVVDARCIGAMYRGFEQILIGRAPRDAMVIAPRVCGICGTAHLYAGVLALEDLWGVPVSAHATAIRNLCLMAESVQSDLRQTFLFFAVDFCNPAYAGRPWFGEAQAAFEAFKGRMHRETLEETRRLLGLVAIFGGQWPHSSHMLPGGVTSPATPAKLVEAASLVERYIGWIERSVLGGPLEEWVALASADAAQAWQCATPARQASALSVLERLARAEGLHRLGAGTEHFISFGAFCEPVAWSEGRREHLYRAGFLGGDGSAAQTMDQLQITEDVRHSWFQRYEGGRHPWHGETIPDYQPGQAERYTWAKAPRYNGRVAQTGPLAELLVAGDSLLADLRSREGTSAWLRQLARVRRAARVLLDMRSTLGQLRGLLREPHFIPVAPAQERDGQGVGMVEAARGALGHWVKVRGGVVEKYQIVTPTAWNASPRDSEGQRGPWEQSVIGLPVGDPDNPVLIGHVVRSHDPCLVCTVHFLDTGRRHRFGV